MNRFSRRFTKTAPLILVGLFLDQSLVNQSAQALTGGPFDDGQFPGINADGTYSGTMVGQNLIGIVSFGVSASQETNGRFSVFHEGFVHYGAATGFADLANKTVAGTLLGVATLGGSGVAGGVSVAETTGGSGAPNGAIQTLTVRTGAEGAFIASMRGYPNQITFDGQGRLSTNANTAVVTTRSANPNFKTTGFTTFFGADGSPQLQTDSVNDNFSNNGNDTNIGATAGRIVVDSNTQRAILRSESPFRIRGSRTSRTVYQAINSYTSTAPLALSANTPLPTTPVATPIPVIVPLP